MAPDRCRDKGVKFKPRNTEPQGATGLTQLTAGGRLATLTSLPTTTRTSSPEPQFTPRQTGNPDGP
jgi:hypothetical protein